MDMEQEFPHAPDLIYLNHAGVGPWPARAGEAVRRFAEENVAQGAADYPRWLQVEQRLRERLARLINAPSPDDIALVKNTSEGLSIIAYGLDWKAGDQVIINRSEFPSNRVVWESLAPAYGVDIADVDFSASADPESDLIAAITPSTRLMSVSSVQYGTGLRMDLERLAAACRDKGVLLCVDAIQSLGALNFDLNRVPADFVTADGHKWMLGPEGLGLLYTRPEIRDRIRLRQFGWHMVEESGNYDRLDWTAAHSARRFECGSPNMVGVHGLESSLSLLEEVGYEHIEESVLANSRNLFDLVETKDNLELITRKDPGRYAGIVTFGTPGADTEAVYRDLKSKGVPCAKRGGGIRFSPHFYISTAQLQEAVALASELARLHAD